MLHAAHGEPAVLVALGRAVVFRRWPAGQASVLTLPSVPTRPLTNYAADAIIEDEQ